MTPSDTPTITPTPGETTQPLLAALDALLEPMAQLCVGKGVPIQAVEEHLRRAFVQAARQACAGANPQRLQSRISALTGLTRREVARIETLAPRARPTTHSPVNELFTRWMSTPPYGGPNGPRELPRQGPEPSFETLATSVTRDVHPRSLLEALCRLGMAVHDTERDCVRLGPSGFVPRQQWEQLLAFLGANVGDHLRAAVVNVLGDGPEHFEQALYADELSSHSLQLARHIVSDQWRALLANVTPQLEALMLADAEAGRPQDQALRLGLYALSQPMPPADTHTPPSTEPAQEP